MPLSGVSNLARFTFKGLDGTMTDLFKFLSKFGYEVGIGACLESGPAWNRGAPVSSGIKLSLPENFWVLTTHAQDVSFALNFRQQHPGCMAISLEKHLGPITRLVNAHIPTYCLQFFGNKSAVLYAVTRDSTLVQRQRMKN